MGTQKNKATLLSDVNAKFPDNIQQLIKAAVLRGYEDDLITSLMTLSDNLSQSTDLSQVRTNVAVSEAALKTIVDNITVGGWNYDADNNKIINLTSGTAAGDAVNFSQLDALDTFVKQRANISQTVTVTANAVTIDCDSGTTVYILLNANINTFTVNNHADGAVINVILEQDATGSRTVATPTGYTVVGSSLDINSTGNSVTWMRLIYSADASDKWVETRNTSAGGGGSGGIDNEYANLANAISGQGSQTEDALYYIGDGSGFTGISSGYVYVQYLGTSIGTEADYRIISAYEWQTRIDAIEAGLDDRTFSSAWTQGASIDFEDGINRTVTLTSDQEITTLSNASDRYKFINIVVQSTGYNLTFNVSGLVQRGQSNPSGPYNVLVYWNGTHFLADYTYIQPASNQLLYGPWRIDNGATPSSGDISFEDFADQENTAYLRVHETNRDGNTATNILMSLQAGAKIAISERDDTNVFNSWTVSGSPTDGGVYIQIPVTSPADNFNTSFSNNENVTFWILSNGDVELTDTLQSVYNRGNQIDLNGNASEEFIINDDNSDEVKVTQSVFEGTKGNTIFRIQNANGKISYDDSTSVSVDSAGANLAAGGPTGNSIRVLETGNIIAVSDAILTPFLATQPQDILTLAYWTANIPSGTSSGTFTTQIDLDLLGGRFKANASSPDTSMPNVNKDTLTRGGFAQGYITLTSGIPTISFVGTAPDPDVWLVGDNPTASADYEYTMGYDGDDIKIAFVPYVSYGSVGSGVVSDIIALYNAAGTDLTTAQENAWDTFYTTIGDTRWNYLNYLLISAMGGEGFKEEAHALVDATGNFTTSKFGSPAFSTTTGWGSFNTDTCLDAGFSTSEITDNTDYCFGVLASNASDGVFQSMFGVYENGNNAFLRFDNANAVRGHWAENNIITFGTQTPIATEKVYTIARPNATTIAAYSDATLISSTTSDADERTSTDNLYIGARNESGSGAEYWRGNIHAAYGGDSALAGDSVFINALKQLFTDLG